MMLRAVIAHSEIVVACLAAVAPRLSRDFDDVDIAILEWIEAESTAHAAVLSCGLILMACFSTLFSIV